MLFTALPVPRRLCCGSAPACPYYELPFARAERATVFPATYWFGVPPLLVTKLHAVSVAACRAFCNGLLIVRAVWRLAYAADAWRHAAFRSAGGCAVWFVRRTVPFLPTVYYRPCRSPPPSPSGSAFFFFMLYDVRLL